MTNHMALPLYVIVLAAGKGTRMKSETPKVLHRIGEKPMLGHVLDNIQQLNAKKVFVVCGHGADQLKAWVAKDAREVEWVEQLEQLGTGHAVGMCLPVLKEVAGDLNSKVLIVSGDVPLTTAETLRLFSANRSEFGLLTLQIANPAGYGRILRDESGVVCGVVEEKDATELQRAICEVNTNVMCVDLQLLDQLLPLIQNNNAQGEYYLPDLIGLARQAGKQIAALKVDRAWEVQGVNDRVQLQELERVYQKNRADECMRDGLWLRDANRIDLRGEFEFGLDCECDINVIIEGKVQLGNNVYIGPNVRLKNVKIGDGTRVLGFCDIDGAVFGPDCQVGPYARVRPGTELVSGAKLGNFVETKNAKLGPGAKVNHLSYAGDCELGRAANVGAGTIFCNFDGVRKNYTKIGEGAFIGSNTCLVAPLEIGSGVIIGAGSTITKNVPDNALAVARTKARVIEDWHPSPK